MDIDKQKDTTARPGDRIRVEEYSFGAENFMAAAYLPEAELRHFNFVSLVAVDVATDYILGFRLTRNPSVNDVAELLALVMRDKSNIARRFGGRSWKGWCRPKVIEARANGVFADPQVRQLVAGIGIEIVSTSNLDVPATMQLASHACVSPVAVRRMRADDEKMKKGKKIKSRLFLGAERVQAYAYLPAAVEHEFFHAICCGVQDTERDEGARTQRAFLKVREQETPPTDHELRLMLCEELEGPVIEQNGLEVEGFTYDSYRLEELGYEIEDQKTAIKVGGWNLDSISVRNFDGTWFEVEIADDDVPAGLTERESLFASSMAQSALAAGEAGNFNHHYYHHLERMRHRHLPVFNPFPLLKKRHKKGSRTGMLPVMWAHERPGYVVKVEEFQIDMGTYFPEAAGETESNVVTVYLAVDAGTAYVLSVKVVQEPSDEAALEFISMMMRDRDEWASESGATHRWPGALTPNMLAYEPDSIFQSGRVFEALVDLSIERLNPTLQVAIDLPALLDGQCVVGSSPDLPKIQAFERLLVRLVCDIYHATPQLILGGRTPREALLDALPVIQEHNPTPSAEKMREAIGREVETILGDEGVVVEGEVYNSDALQVIRGRAGETKVILRYDPRAMSAVSVLPANGRRALFSMWESFIEVPNVSDMSLNRSLKQLAEIREAMSDTEPTVDGLKTDRGPSSARRRTS